MTSCLHRRRTVIGWNTVWDRRIMAMTPVSRSFGVNPWIMWDWDTYFLSLMAAESDKWLGYSNVLTVTRGRTINGQVPNAECAQWTNDDRYDAPPPTNDDPHNPLTGDERPHQLSLELLLCYSIYLLTCKIPMASYTMAGPNPTLAP